MFGIVPESAPLLPNGSPLPHHCSEDHWLTKILLLLVSLSIVQVPSFLSSFLRSNIVIEQATALGGSNVLTPTTSAIYRRVCVATGLTV